MNTYGPYTEHNCISSYEHPEGDWAKCPKCDLRPMVWVFNNGRNTACGCWESKYDYFSIRAESVVSVYNRTENTLEYYWDDLRNNWNTWVETGKVVFTQGENKW